MQDWSNFQILVQTMLQAMLSTFERRNAVTPETPPKPAANLPGPAILASLGGDSGET